MPAARIAKGIPGDPEAGKFGYSIRSATKPPDPVNTHHAPFRAWNRGIGENPPQKAFITTKIADRIKA